MTVIQEPSADPEAAAPRRRESDAKLDALERSQAVIEFSLDGYVLDANDNFLALLDYSLDDVIGQHHRMFCDPDEAASEDYLWFWAELRLGKFSSGEFKRIGRGGRPVWIQATYNPVLDADGVPSKVVKFAIDVTEQRLRTVEFESKLAAISRSQAVAEFSVDGVLLDANDRFLAIMGYSDIADLRGRHHRTFCDPVTSGSRTYSELWARLRRGEYDGGEYRRIDRHGQPVWVQATYNPILDLDGNVRKIVEYAVDVTAEKLQAIDAASRVAAIDRSQAVLELSPDGVVRRANANLLHLLGYELRDLVGRRHSALLPSSPECLECDQRLWEQLARRESVTGRFERRTADGRTIWLQTTYHPVTDPDGHAMSIVAFAQDVTTEVELERQIAHQATHDWLTGLLNRVGGFGLLDRLLDEARAAGSQVAVAFIDLDGFKQINDAHGHRVGDAVLQIAAHRLVEAAHDEGTVIRLGGDEFVVVMPSCVEPRHAVLLGQRLLDRLTGPVEVDGRHAHLAASIGVTIGPLEDRDGSDLIRRADLAAYAAKSSGRGRVRLYDTQLDERLRERDDLERDLREAVRHDHLDVHYQPIVRLTDGSVAGVEALVRFHQPGVGLVPTPELIDVAESSDLIIDLDRRVMDRAFGQIVAWQLRQGLDGLSVSVNLSRRHFRQHDLVDHLLAAADRHALDPRRVIVEVTETAVLQDPRAAADQLGRLRDAGVRVAIDDFGTGYTSIGNLWNLPIDIVKIDRSFIASGDERAAAVVDLMVHAARALGYVVIAEGVETAEQRDRLAELGVDEAQGWLFGRPVADPFAVEAPGAAAAFGELR